MTLHNVLKTRQPAYENGSSERNSRRYYRPSYRIEEKDTEYVAKVDLPGVRKGDLEISLADGVLEVSATRMWPTEGDWKALSGPRDEALAYRLRLGVGDEVNGEGIAASLTDGVLELKLAKAEEKRPRRISVS